MDTGILHLHHLIVVLYTVLLAAKTALLWIRNKNLLYTLNGKTRWLRMGLEILMLLTGVFLAYRSPVGLETYNLVKYIALIGGIGAGIAGVRRLNPVLATLALVCFGYAYAVSKTNSPLLQPEIVRVQAVAESFPAQSATPAESLRRGEAIYTLTCVQCHGPDGRANFRKAKDLSVSPLSDAAKAAMIKSGLNIMPAYTYLTDDEIKDVVLYINKFSEK